MIGFVFLFCLLFRWGVLHRVLLVFGCCWVCIPVVSLRSRMKTVAASRFLGPSQWSSCIAKGGDGGGVYVSILAKSHSSELKRYSSSWEIWGILNMNMRNKEAKSTAVQCVFKDCTLWTIACRERCSSPFPARRMVWSRLKSWFLICLWCIFYFSGECSLVA